MAENKSPYASTIVLQDEALNLLMKMIKCYPIAGDGTGIILAPTEDAQHIQIQNALRFHSTIGSSDSEDLKHPGCICITDLSVPDDGKNYLNRTYISTGNLLEFYKSEQSKGLIGKNIEPNQYGSFIIIKNNDYSNPIVVPIKGFKDNGDLELINNIITAKKVRGAVFNDYAEYRESLIKEPGRCVIETGYGDLELSTKRLQLGGNIISDTFGFSIGETDKAETPIAVCGRVLAYPYENKYKFTAGAAVCSGPNGTVSLMTREEIKEWPDAIIGYVSEIPEYKEWGSDKIQVNNRIWIKIK